MCGITDHPPKLNLLQMSCEDHHAFVVAIQGKYMESSCWRGSLTMRWINTILINIVYCLYSLFDTVRRHTKQHTTTIVLKVRCWKILVPLISDTSRSFENIRTQKIFWFRAIQVSSLSFLQLTTSFTWCTCKFTTRIPSTYLQRSAIAMWSTTPNTDWKVLGLRYNPAKHAVIIVNSADFGLKCIGGAIYM